MRLGLLVLILFALLAFAATEILQRPSGENDEVLHALFRAYGGQEALANIKTYEAWSEQFHTGSGQGYRPESSLQGYDRQIYTIDYAGQQAGHEVWSLYTGSYFHLNTVTTPDNGCQVDYRREIIKTTPPQDLLFVLQRARRENPLLVVRDLALDSGVIKDITPVEAGALLAVRFTLGGTEGTLYLDAGTFLVDRAEFGSGGERETYAYSDYETMENGLVFPRQVDIKTPFIEDGKAANLRVRINEPVEGLLAFEERLKESESLDQSQMIATELGDGVYHVGAFGNYSLFVDQGEYLVAIGGAPGIAQRLAFIRDTGVLKPLKFLAATHHHSDHIGFLSEFAEADTQFITVNSNFAMFIDLFPGVLGTGRLVAVDGALALEAGNAPAVHIIETASPHAYRQLIAYVPAVKVIFSADMFEETSPYPSLQPATENVLSLKRTIEQLGLEVETIATAHSPRILGIEELYQAANRLVPENMCFEARPICSDPIWSDVEPF